MVPEVRPDVRPQSRQHTHEVDPRRWADLGQKLTRLAEVARGRDLDTLVLREPAALTWLWMQPPHQTGKPTHARPPHTPLMPRLGPPRLMAGRYRKMIKVAA